MSERRKGLPSLGRYFGAVWITLAVVSVAVLNSWAGEDVTPGNTISYWATLGGEYSVAVPYFYGGVGGHWASLRWKSWHVPGGVLPTIGIIVLLGLADLLTGSALAQWRPSFVVFLLVGGFIEFFIWPMHKGKVG
jgi:hypothetical protein